jgi:uncharacterized membrane protein
VVCSHHFRRPVEALLMIDRFNQVPKEKKKKKTFIALSYIYILHILLLLKFIHYFIGNKTVCYYLIIKLLKCYIELLLLLVFQVFRLK